MLLVASVLHQTADAHLADHVVAWLKQVQEDLGQPVSSSLITAMDRSMWRSLYGPQLVMHSSE